MMRIARDTLRERVRAFIAENFYVPDMASLSDERSLVESGVVDSTGILEVIAFLETQIGVRVEDAEAVPSNLDSVQNIVAFVERKQASLPEEKAA
jgi:acyl carrier protein